MPLPQVGAEVVGTDVVETVEGAIGSVFSSPPVTRVGATDTAFVDVEKSVVPKPVVAPAVPISAEVGVVTVEMSPFVVQSSSLTSKSSIRANALGLVPDMAMIDL